MAGTDVESTSADGNGQQPGRGLWHTFVITTLCILLNTFCTVCVVFANKVVFSDVQLKNCQVITAAWHFLATNLVLRIACSRTFNVFTEKRVPIWDILPISLLFVGFLLLGNLSLALNPVAFYQIAKIMTTPTVVAINFLVFGKRIRFSLVISVLICCGGVMLTVGDAALSNITGTAVAAIAFITTAFYQIWIGKKMTDLDVTPSQLLLNQAPLSACILLIIAPMTDVLPVLSEIEPRVVQVFILSGFLAAGLNFSQFLIIGRTSALTFNVVSNAKNIIIIAIGWWQSGKVVGVFDLLAVSLALGGATAYSVLCRRTAGFSQDEKSSSPTALIGNTLRDLSSWSRQIFRRGRWQPIQNETEKVLPS